jgi:hypothetical protein
MARRQLAVYGYTIKSFLFWNLIFIPAISELASSIIRNGSDFAIPKLFIVFLIFSYPQIGCSDKTQAEL